MHWEKERERNDCGTNYSSLEQGVKRGGFVRMGWKRGGKEDGQTDERAREMMLGKSDGKVKGREHHLSGLVHCGIDDWPRTSIMMIKNTTISWLLLQAQDTNSIDVLFQKNNRTSNTALIKLFKYQSCNTLNIERRIDLLCWFPSPFVSKSIHVAGATRTVVISKKLWSTLWKKTS